MAEKKDEEFRFTAPENAVELIDLGDAVEETKQLHPQGNFPDCIYVRGVRPGC